jgi:hypothetical protein
MAVGEVEAVGTEKAEEVEKAKAGERETVRVKG